MIGRRKFLTFIGAVPAGGLAAKSALDTELAKLTRVTDALAPPSLLSNSGYALPEASHLDYRGARIRAIDWSRTFGTPDFVKETMRRNNSSVYSLDPDLAAKRSWSMSVKIQEQRQRNYQRAMEALEHDAWSYRAQSVFKSLSGWEWPW